MFDLIGGEEREEKTNAKPLSRLNWDVLVGLTSQPIYISQPLFNTHVENCMSFRP